MSIKGYKDDNGNIQKYDINSLDVPFTAEVGQVLVVKAVDENGKPIEWECIDPFTLIDESNDKKYKLSVLDGKLTMEEVIS